MLKYVGLLMLFMMCLVAPATASAGTPAKFESLYEIVSKPEIPVEESTDSTEEASADSLVESIDSTEEEDVQEITEDDRRQITCLALNIYHEARGSSVRDQWAVGLVTLNRAKRGIWGPSICDVVWISNLVRGKRVAQFSWTLRPVKTLIPREEQPWQNALRKAQVLYTGGKADFTNGATHFYLAHLNPGWARAGRGKIRIGDHIYMRIHRP